MKPWIVTVVSVALSLGLTFALPCAEQPVRSFGIILSCAVVWGLLVYIVTVIMNKLNRIEKRLPKPDVVGVRGPDGAIRIEREQP